MAYNDIAPNVTRWVKVSKTFTDFSTAALVNTINIYSLAPNEYISDVFIKPSVAFTGGAIASYTISVGIVSDVTKYALARSAFTGFSIKLPHTAIAGMESSSVAVNITATATATGANLDQANTGSVDIYLQVSTLP